MISDPVEAFRLLEDGTGEDERSSRSAPVSKALVREDAGAMIIAAIVAVCVVLFILALLAPRLSIWPQKGVSRTLGAGARTGSKAPGLLGKAFGKSFSTSRKATNKSADAGRKTRGKLPLSVALQIDGFYALRVHR